MCRNSKTSHDIDKKLGSLIKIDKSKNMTKKTSK